MIYSLMLGNEVNEKCIYFPPIKIITEFLVLILLYEMQMETFSTQTLLELLNFTDEYVYYFSLEKIAYLILFNIRCNSVFQHNSTQTRISEKVVYLTKNFL